MWNRASPAPARPPARRGPRGFTLLELLVALALMGTILALLYQSFFQISQGAVQLEAEITQQQELRLLLKLVVDDLQAARVLDTLLEQNIATGIVARTDHLRNTDFSRVTFHAAVPVRFHRTVIPARDPRLHELAYWVEEEPETKELLLMRREDFYVDRLPDEGGIAVPIARGIAVFRVEFLPYAAPSATAQETWRDEWDSTQTPVGFRLPMAIRVTLGRAQGERPVVEESLEINLPSSLEVRE